MSAMIKPEQTVVAGSKKEQIIALLTTTTMKPSEIAWAVSCDQGYINQLLEDPEVAHRVAKARMELLQSYSKRDQKYDDFEDKVLKTLESKIDTHGPMIKIETLLRAVQTINGAKRRGQVSNAVETPAHAIVNLTLPVFILNQFRVDGNNEVVSVGERGLITMPSQTVMQKLKDHNKEIETIPSKDVPVLEDKSNERRTETEVSRRVEAATISAERI